MTGKRDDHELVRVFAAHGLALNGTLSEMLNEHFSHCTARRGCGFTQATRHLAVLVNRPRAQQGDTMARLFPTWVRALNTSAAAGPELRQKVREAAGSLEREESRLLADLIADLVSPQPVSAQELPPALEEIKVGTCPLAEKYFFEIAERFARRGRVNVLVSEALEPLLIEKIDLGDSHSCVSVKELVLNGVRLPPGCLLGVAHPQDAELRPNRELRGSIIPLSRCDGFRFLRLTTLAVSPANRARAFTAHFQAQIDAALYRPQHVTVEQLRRVALEQLSP